MAILEFIADKTGTAFMIAMAIIVIAAIIRVIIKSVRGEKITITPVGVANDLPDSVTGMNKYEDALSTEKNEENDWE